MAQFPILANTRLAVIYDTGAAIRRMPGIGCYDGIGFDRYDDGERIFTNGRYASLKAALLQWQTIILVPGGAFGQGPVPFLAVAQQDPQVSTVVGFIYFDYWGGTHRLGIRSNGMGPAYCRMGALILHPENSNPDCSGDPIASLTVNGGKEVVAEIGEPLNYEWVSARGTNWYSYWTTADPVCGGGKLSGDWKAMNASGNSSWPAMAWQADCTYEIRFVVGGFMASTEDAISVRILPAPAATISSRLPKAAPTLLASRHHAPRARVDS